MGKTIKNSELEDLCSLALSSFSAKVWAALLESTEMCDRHDDHEVYREVLTGPMQGQSCWALCEVRAVTFSCP